MHTFALVKVKGKNWTSVKSVIRITTLGLRHRLNATACKYKGAGQSQKPRM